MNLIIGSNESSSGKSAIVLGLGLHLQEHGFTVGYAKPIGTAARVVDSKTFDEDSYFITHRLDLTSSVPSTLVFSDKSTVRLRLLGQDTANYCAQLEHYLVCEPGKLCLIEAAGTPQEGAIFGLSLPQLVQSLEADVLLVCRCHDESVLDQLLALRTQIGSRLLGVVLNDIPESYYSEVGETLAPFIEKQGIAVLAMLPTDTVLRSISVGELAKALSADVLCCRDRLDLMVESFDIGAMNANSALRYFRKSSNKAVITGGDRTDIQLAALETSTSCLILTGQLPPPAVTLARAGELEVPVLLVSHDTLSTVGIVERLFGQARLREPEKVRRVQQLLAYHFDFERFYNWLGFDRGTPVS
ncbi:MAG: phosphotransacetylase family protein [Gemmatimonadaceae bacterium]|nr:phosphotransacetylase family protein [Gloeobacterales cyanobacterium ES-bin-141]